MPEPRARYATTEPQMKDAVKEVFDRHGADLTFEQTKALLKPDMQERLTNGYFKKLRQKARAAHAEPTRRISQKDINGAAEAARKVITPVTAKVEEQAPPAGGLDGAGALGAGAAPPAEPQTFNARYVIDAMQAGRTLVNLFGKEGAVELIRAL
jgi:hypothetical protein